MQFQYTYVGDTLKTFNGKLITPGDLIEADEELINGEFSPTNKAAKDAWALRAALEYPSLVPAVEPKASKQSDAASTPAASKE